MSPTVTLTPDLVHVFYQDNPTTEVKTAAQLDNQGHVRIALGTGAQGPEIDRVEIDLTGPLQTVDLGNESLDAFNVGAIEQWREVTPAQLAEVSQEGSGCSVAARSRGFHSSVSVL